MRTGTVAHMLKPLFLFLVAAAAPLVHICRWHRCIWVLAIQGPIDQGC